MFFFLPFRAKNPPEHFPYVTAALIVINTLIYALTTQYFLRINEEVVRAFAVSHDTFSVGRLFSAMFLHANLMHLFGNMLFLWVFGASVEGRLRPLKYLALYLAAGLVGGALDDLMVGVNSPDRYSLGASGAIMGVAGAYLYLFPYSTIRCFYFYWLWLIPRIGVTEWHARWVVLMYVGLDLLQGFLFRGIDGVGHFAHLGGFGAGLLCVMIFGARRDTEEFSAAQAVRSDMRDYSLLNFSELEPLMQQPAPDVPLVINYCSKALTSIDGRAEEKCLAALQHHGRLLVEQAEPNQLAEILLRLSPNYARTMPPVFLLRVGSRLERASSYDLATRLYRRLYELHPESPDTEAALYRMGRLMEQTYLNHTQARAFYTEMLRLFPHGAMAMDAQRSLQQLSPEKRSV